MKLIFKILVLAFVAGFAGVYAQNQDQNQQAAAQMTPEEKALVKKYSTKTMEEILTDIKMGDEKTRQEVTFYLTRNKRMRGELQENLINIAIDDTNPASGVWAIRCLAKSTSGTVSKMLIGLLYKEDNRAIEAARLLGENQKNTKAVNHLIKRMMESKNYIMRKNCAWALGEIAVSSSGKFLYAQYNREVSAAVKAEIMDAMSKMRYNPSLDLAFEEVKSKNATIKAAALVAIGRSGLEEGFPIMQKALRDPNPVINGAAKTALDEYRIVNPPKQR